MPNIAIQEKINQINMPENLSIGLMVAEKRNACQSQGIPFNMYSFALGQSPFHVPFSLQKAVAKNLERGNYSDAAGILELRKSIALFNKRFFNVEIAPEDIFIAPGTKSILSLIFSVIDGTAIIPSPSWIGYKPLLTYAGKGYVKMPLKKENDFKIVPKDLQETLSSLKDQGILILNNPNNPSGVVYSREELMDIAKVCREMNAIVLSDEIYALTTYKQETFVSMREIYPEGTFVTNGLSKDRSAGGYRFGTCLLPEDCTDSLRDAFKKISASLFSNVCTPLQYGAIEVYNENEEIDEYFRITREIHRIMGKNLAAECNKIDDLSASDPAGGFYFLLDFNKIKEKLLNNDINTGHQLAMALLKDPWDVALISGDAISVDEDDFLARIAFVDYDGYQAFLDYQKRPPANQEEEVAFFEKHGENMIEGCQSIKAFIKQL